MSKYIHFSTDHGPFVFKLLDTDFANFWLEHFLKIQKHFPLVTNARYWPYVDVTELDSSIVNAKIEKILDSVDKINSLYYIVPLPEPVERSVLEKLNLETQALLNRLHRYLVVATERRDRWTLTQGKQFKFIPFNFQEVNYLFNLLNQNIHSFEEHVNTPNRHEFNCFIPSVEVSPSASYYEDCVVYIDNVDVKIPKELKKDLRLYGHDVWIKKDTLGKDFITAFADHDDHTQPDIKAPPIISGGIEIDVDNSRQKFFQHAKFKEWLGKTPTDQQGSYPVGDIVERPDNLIDITEFSFINITTDQ